MENEFTRHRISEKASLATQGFFPLVSPLISVNKFDKKYWNRSVNALKNPTLSCLVLGVDLFLIFTFIRCESLVVCTTGVLVISLLTGEWFCFSDTKRTSHVVVFFCKHVYHEDCLPARDVVSNDQVKISKAVFGIRDTSSAVRYAQTAAP